MTGEIRPSIGLRKKSFRSAKSIKLSNPVTRIETGRSLSGPPEQFYVKTGNGTSKSKSSRSHSRDFLLPRIGKGPLRLRQPGP